MVELTFSLNQEVQDKLKIVAERAEMTPEEFLSDLLEKEFGGGGAFEEVPGSV